MPTKRKTVARTSTKRKVSRRKTTSRPKKRSALAVLLRSPKGSSRTKLIVFVLVFAAIGSTLLYASFASPFAGFSPVDEQDQVSRINNQRNHYTDDGRFPSGENSLKVAGCLTTAHETNAKNEAAKGSISDLSGQADFNACHITVAQAPAWAGSNTVFINGCTSPGNDKCSSGGFTALMNSSDHKNNILQPCALAPANPPAHLTSYCPVGPAATTVNYDLVPKYVGVGVYRDGKGGVYVSQGFIACSNCTLAWTLSGSTTASAPGIARANNISVTAGTTVTFYHNSKNDNGPDTATYPEHVNSYHYAASGALLFSANNLHVVNLTAGPGVVNVWTDQITIPASAKNGEQYCRLTYFGNADGAYTDPATTNKACATVR